MKASEHPFQRTEVATWEPTKNTPVESMSRNFILPLQTLHVPKGTQQQTSISLAPCFLACRRALISQVPFNKSRQTLQYASSVLRAPWKIPNKDEELFFLQYVGARTEAGPTGFNNQFPLKPCEVENLCAILRTPRPQNPMTPHNYAMQSLWSQGCNFLHTGIIPSLVGVTLPKP